MQATLLWNSVDSERRVIMSEQTKTVVKQGGMKYKSTLYYGYSDAFCRSVRAYVSGDCHSDHAIIYQI